MRPKHTVPLDLLPGAKNRTGSRTRVEGREVRGLEVGKSLLVFTDSQLSLFLRNKETEKTGSLLYDNRWLCTSTSEVGAQSFRGGGGVVDCLPL